MIRFATAFAAFALLATPAFAEFLSPDWADLKVKGIIEPDWIAGVRDGDYIGMCVGCDETMMLQVQVRPDDGTGGRVHSGVTTAETFTEIGKTNAEQLGNGAQYFGTEDITFASAKGFQSLALTAAGDYSSTFQLWDDGQQLIVKVYGKQQSEVEALAQKLFDAAAPLTFN